MYHAGKRHGPDLAKATALGSTGCNSTGCTQQRMCANGADEHGSVRLRPAGCMGLAPPGGVYHPATFAAARDPAAQQQCPNQQGCCNRLRRRCKTSMHCASPMSLCTAVAEVAECSHESSKTERCGASAGVSRAGARTGLQLPGHGDMQGFNSSSPAHPLLPQADRTANANRGSGATAMGRKARYRPQTCIAQWESGSLVN